MSLRVLEDLCIGCGACDFACPTGALAKTDSFLGLFSIDPYTCNDCGICVPKCPVGAITVDPSWPVCQGHGCPLTSKRLSGFDCAYWLHRCPTCGSTLWRSEGQRWTCPGCDLGMRVRCPKSVHQAAGRGADAGPRPEGSAVRTVTVRSGGAGPAHRGT